MLTIFIFAVPDNLNRKEFHNQSSVSHE